MRQRFDEPLEPSLDTDEAAAVLGVSPRTLEKKRVTGGGPTYVKLFRKVVYLPKDLRAYLESNRRENTSQR
jgi:hypothetical protein